MARANPPQTPQRRRIRRLSNGLAFAILIAIVAIFLLWSLVVHTTPVGHASIIWHRFVRGGDTNSTGPLGEGMHFTWPWDKFYTYDLRLQTFDQEYEVVSNDGLHVDITLTFRWRAFGPSIVMLNDTVGPNYLQTLLVPVVGSVAREVIAKYDAERLYSDERTRVQNDIYARVVSQDYDNGIVGRVDDGEAHQLVVLEDTLIKAVKLPVPLQDAIERKLEQAQKVQEYGFRVQTERLESQRKQIEGEGIRAFQEIVTPAISESYLRWRGIEATLKLAESNNAKVVVIGNSATGLPLILDTGSQDLTMPPQPAAAPAAATAPVSPILETGDGERILSPRTDTPEGNLVTGDPVAPADEGPVERVPGSSIPMLPETMLERLLNKP